MKMKLKLGNVSAILLAAAMISLLFTGCGKKLTERENAIKKYGDIMKKTTASQSAATVKTLTVNYQKDGSPASDTIVFSSEIIKDNGTVSAVHFKKSTTGDCGDSYIDLSAEDGKLFIDFSGQSKLCSSAASEEIEKCLASYDPDVAYPDPDHFSDVGCDETSTETIIRYYIPDTSYLAELSDGYKVLYGDYIPFGTLSDVNGKIIYNKSSKLTVCSNNFTVSEGDSSVTFNYTAELTGTGDSVGVNVPDAAEYTEVPGLPTVFDYLIAVDKFEKTTDVSLRYSTDVSISGSPEKHIGTAVTLDSKTDADGIITFKFNEQSKAENQKDYKDYDLDYEYDGSKLSIKMTGEEDQTMDITQMDAAAFITAHLNVSALLDPELVTSVTTDGDSGERTIVSGVGKNSAEIVNDSLNKFGYYGEYADMQSFLPESTGKTVIDKNGNIIKTEYHIVFTFSYYESEEYTCTIDFTSEL